MNNILTLPNSSRFRHFDWDKAKTFYYVANLGSFTEASKFMHTSQPALSRQIQNLERSLGCILFCRNPRGLTLTRKGEELQKIIETTFQQLKDFTQEIQRPQRGEPRTLRMGLPASLMFPVFNILKDYQRSHLSLTLELAEDLGKDMPLLDLDMALRPFQKGASSVQQQPLIEVDQNLFSSSVVINSERSAEALELFFVTPSVLKEDEEIKDIYHVLRSGLEDVKNTGTEQKEAA